MGKLKVGDRFRVKNGLIGGKFYDGLYFGSHMEEYCDKVFTVSDFGLLGGYRTNETTCVFNDAMIEPVTAQSNQSIHITIVGNTSIAVLKDGKNVVKRTFATCNPSDTFDFNIGAKLAFERLMGVTEDKPIQYREVERPAKDNTPKFKFGDKVRILDGKNIERYTHGWGYAMKDDIGKICTIKSMERIEPSYGYRLNESLCTWDERGLELAVETAIQIREVKREAKDGEYVRVVNSTASDNSYSNGDICKCIDMGPGGGGYIKTKGTHPCNIGEGTSYIYKEEYVVLEGYQAVEKTYTQSEVDTLIKAERERIKESVEHLFKEKR